MKLVFHSLRVESRPEALHLFLKILNAGPRLLASRGRKGLRLAGLCTIALLLTACSGLKIAYNQTPELAYWYFDTYADFNGTQSVQLKTDLGQLHAWHRQTQLPGYIIFLQDTQRQVGGDISSTESCRIFFEVRTKLLVVNARAEDFLAKLAYSLDARQLQIMKKRYAKGNAEYRDTFVDGTPEALRKRRLDKLISRAEMLYGRLDNNQKALLGRIVDQSKFDAARNYAERLKRQQDTLDTIRRMNDTASNKYLADKGRQSFNELMGRLVNSPDLAYRDYTDKLINDNCKSFSEFHNATSTEQRNHAVSALGNYENDFKILMRQGGS